MPSFITSFIRTYSLLGLSLVFVSCQAYVRDVPSPADLIGNQDINSESTLPILYTGIGGAIGDVQRQLSPLASTLSDEFMNVNALSSERTESTIFNLDDGNPDNSQNAFRSIWTQIAITRYQGRVLLEKIPTITFSQESNRRRALFIGHFFRAVSEHYLAAFWGISARRGGGVIDGGKFIPSSAMHDTCLRKFTLALENAPGIYEQRLVNSFVARIHLLEGRYPEALTAATNGLQQGDEPFQSLYAENSFNWWVDYSGLSGASKGPVIPHPRFRDYVVADSAEAGRIKLVQGTKPAAGRTEPYFVQAKYSATTPIDIMTWQENALMLAELFLRVKNDTVAALRQVNLVRTAVAPLPSGVRLSGRTRTNLDSIYIERDKQFFGTGLRLLDQRRFNRWTQFTGLNAVTAWYFLPIPKREFDTNPNLQAP